MKALALGAVVLTAKTYGDWIVSPNDVDDGGITTWANTSYSVTPSGSEYLFSGWGRVDVYLPWNFNHATYRVDNAYNYIYMSYGSSSGSFSFGSVSNISDASNRDVGVFTEAVQTGANVNTFAWRDPY